MTNHPFLAGQFVWCSYPKWEHPLDPGPRHVGYILAAFARAGSPVAMVAYTTSRRWPGTVPLAVYPITAEEAAPMGQAKAFVIDARRIAFIPVTEIWFPDLTHPNRGCVGGAPHQLRARIQADMERLFKRSPANLERLGNLWQ